MNHIYKAMQCTDLNDCDYAIKATIEFIRELERKSKPTSAAYKRLISLKKRREQLQRREALYNLNY